MNALTATGSTRWRRASELIDQFLEEYPSDEVTLGDLVAMLGNRAFGALLLVFALPNVIPMPPGTSTVLGLPLVLFAAQMTLGLPKPWLPKRLARLPLDRAMLERWTNAGKRYIAWIEGMMKPRLPFLADVRFERALGAVCLLLALILSLPIPLGNMLPALAIVMMALGLLEKDGLVVLFGLITAAFSGVLVAAVMFGLAKGLLMLVAVVFT
ncbi:MAG TPA: exopolysaccharide biosynthesis protein [Azospirillaceae bacterium]|nr:exopolysaccharide biosynthesis protein [Azospirillaceae bacterium]